MLGNKENRKKFYCESCDYTTANKYDFMKHQTTRKHLNGDFLVKLAMISDKNIANIYSCKCCDYNTSNKNHYSIHLTTRKHLGNVHNTKITNSTSHICNQCNKEYTNYNALWKHKKKCVIPEVYNIIEKEQDTKPEPLQNSFIEQHNISKNKFTSELFMEIFKESKELQNVLIEQNKELQNKLLEKETELHNKLLEKEIELHNKLLEKENQLLEQNAEHHKEIVELAKKQTTNINSYNTNNQQFNLQFFLNETCKDAMNLVDFVNLLIYHKVSR
jgi:hypothetical protein